MKKISSSNEVMVVKGRHTVINNLGQEVTASIFDEVLDVRDVAELQRIADEKIAAIPGTTINLYVTGLTVAVIAIINAVIKTSKELVFWHYDRETGKYYSQRLEEFLGRW